MNLHWTAFAIRVVEPNGTDLVLTITDAGTVRRVLPATGTDVPLVDEHYQPITSAPLRSAADAMALVERVRMKLLTH